MDQSFVAVVSRLWDSSLGWKENGSVFCSWRLRRCGGRKQFTILLAVERRIISLLLTTFELERVHLISQQGSCFHYKMSQASCWEFTSSSRILSPISSLEDQNKRRSNTYLQEKYELQAARFLHWRQSLYHTVHQVEARHTFRSCWKQAQLCAIKLLNFENFTLDYNYRHLIYNQ